MSDYEFTQENIDRSRKDAIVSGKRFSLPLVHALDEITRLQSELAKEKEFGAKANELQKLQDDIVEWSTATFGDRQTTAIPVCHHLKKEVNELIEGIEKGDYKEEFADCFMLLIEAAKTCGISTDELISLTYAKLENNKSRTWGQPDENGVIEHIKESA